MLFFCPKCDFKLDINKNIPIDYKNNDKINISDINIFINLCINDELQINNKLNFTIKDLSNNNKFSSLSKELQNEIMNKFKNNNNNHGYLLCNNCQYITKLNNKTVIYHNVISDSNYNHNIDYPYLDKTLPRTKDFICPNKKCLSHKNNSDKEAVFYRSMKNSYEIQYNCSTCNTKWNLVNK